MKEKFTLPDFLIIVILVFGAVVASPFVMRQFVGLSKTADIIWNVSFDVVIVSAVLLVAYVIRRLIKKHL